MGPQAILDYEIELLDFKVMHTAISVSIAVDATNSEFGKTKDPLPRFPSKAELEQTRKKTEEEERKRLEENPPPTTGICMMNFFFVSFHVVNNYCIR